MKPRKPANLREACVREALKIIGESGVESLSIREVARRLGVSHQAPYKHFPSSGHLLAEIVRRTFSGFSAALEGRPRGNSPRDEMRCMGEAYLAYALEHPLHYRLMFGTPLPDPALHPEMMEEARKAFAVLLDGVSKMRGDPGAPATAETQFDALFVWSVVHGLASILKSDAIGQIGLDPATLSQAAPHVLARIGKAISPDTQPAPAAKRKVPHDRRKTKPPPRR